MGQYFIIVNLDRKEYLEPEQFGEGVKLMQFGLNDRGTLTGLAILLAASDDTGRPTPRRDEAGAAIAPPDPVIGRWAGQRIAVIGDYQVTAHAPHIEIPGAGPAFFDAIRGQKDGWVDISEHVVATLETLYGLTTPRERLGRDPHGRLRHRSVLHADGSVTAVPEGEHN